MMDEYMKKYREQMDGIVLSDAADREILDDLLKIDDGKEVMHMRRGNRKFSAAVAAAVIVLLVSLTACAGIAIYRTIIQSNKQESQVEGLGAKVDVGESYYYGLLAGENGEIYVLTDNDYDGALTDHHAIAWKSTDQGDTWEEILHQPEELGEDSYVFAGDLRESDTGIEAVVIVEEASEGAKNGYLNRVYHITADSYEEYDMSDVYAKLGDQDQLWSVKYVNDHTIALAGTERCLLYDTEAEQIVKELPCDLTMAFLNTQDQFLIYGKEIDTCLDAETLAKEEAGEGLQEFVKAMYAENDNDVVPPMTVWKDTVSCITTRAIYEYQDGAWTQVRMLSKEVNRGLAFNGMLPFCMTREGEYYVCTFGDMGDMSLWQIDAEKEVMK